MKFNKAKIILIEDDMNFAINSAISLFRTGRTFIYPTDTIYGIGGNPFNKKTVNKITEIKGRPKNHKFIYLTNDLNFIKKHSVLKEKRVSGFLRKIWPAPVSIILELKRDLSRQIGSSTAAFRIPDNKYCLKLLNGLNTPLISTSVNKSGQKALNNKKNIVKEFSYLVDAIFFFKGRLKNQASTIIDLTGKNPKLVREGTIKFETILKSYYS